MTETTLTIAEIIAGCRLGGINLEQRLAAVDFSSIRRQQIEAELIITELKRRKEAAA